MSDKGIFQVVFMDEVKPVVEEWLASRGCHLVQIPKTVVRDGDDDTPTYVIGINNP